MTRAMSSSPRTEAQAPPAPVFADPAEHQVSTYARDVVEGRVVAGKWVKLACERHLRDLEDGPSRGLWFDGAAADRVVRYFAVKTRHTQGSDFAGNPILLLPWQVFMVGSIFGWKRADAYRRIRIAYIETGKKTGKSTLAGCLADYATFSDDPPKWEGGDPACLHDDLKQGFPPPTADTIRGRHLQMARWAWAPCAGCGARRVPGIEMGAQGYTAATVRKQARATFDEARAQVQQSPGLRKNIKAWGGDGHNMRLVSRRPELRQVLMPLGKDSDGLDGVNVHFAVVDELHKHRDRTVWDVLVDSRKARRQPLIIAITNAGYDETTVCWEQHRRGEQILEGSKPNDDSFFAFMCCIDKGDDWRDPKVWVKANPSLGTVVKLSDYQEDCDRALSSPGYVNTFRRYGCGEWVAVDERAFDLDRWKACAIHPVEPEALRGRLCYGGLDLSSTIDLTAFVLLFPPLPGEKHWPVLCWFWMPAENVRRRQLQDDVHYDAWIREGFVETTPGSSVDYAFIERRVIELRKLYRIHQVGYDFWEADPTQKKLTAAGIKMVVVRQGHQTLGNPTKRVEALYMEGNLAHGGNPVLLWMASNVVWRRNANDQYIPDKAKAGKAKRRIDGISALLDALAVAMKAPPAPSRPYLTRKVRRINLGGP